MASISIIFDNLDILIRVNRKNNSSLTRSYSQSIKVKKLLLLDLMIKVVRLLTILFENEGLSAIRVNGLQKLLFFNKLSRGYGFALYNKLIYYISTKLSTFFVNKILRL